MKVYTASKLEKAVLWNKLISEWPEVEFTARWVTEFVNKVPQDECYAKWFWQIDLADVEKADIVLLYAEEHEHLRGALIEAGAALAWNKIVIVVGSHKDYGTWQHHPNVYKAVDLLQARDIISVLAYKK